MGIGAILGGLAGAGLSSAGQIHANRTNKGIAREQMQFQDRMSSTAYQRATQDMRKAGLNPMLAYQQGGASTPAGATAHMENALSPAVSSALEVRRQNADIKAIKSQVELNRELQNQAKQKARFNSASAKQADAQSKFVKTQNQIATYDSVSSKNASQMQKDLGKYGKYAGFVKSLFK